jgi:DNA-binding LacI/PurR family transcriptional regulator
MAVTIKKIAELAGVAPTTVSLVLRNSQKISEATKRQVLRIIEETDYYPNQSGKTLKQGRTDAIAIISSYFQNLFKMDFVNGVEQAIFPTKYELRHYYAQSGTEGNRCKEILFGKMADAVLAMNFLPETEYLEKMHKARKPIVLVEDTVKGFAGVRLDNFAASSLAVDYLLKRGRKRIAIILAMKAYMGHSFLDERLRGYIAALRERQLEYSEIIEIPDYSLESGHAIYHRLQEKSPRPDALYCASGDITAAGFLQEAIAHGMQVPDDIAVMGFDDSIIAQTTTLGLTTVRQPVQEMGRAAFQLAVDMIEGADPQASSRIITFQPEIIVRQSA